MKNFNEILAGGVALFASLCLLHAQPATSSTGPADDLSVMLEALEQTAPQPGDTTPSAGNFVSAQHAGDWPPLPGNVLGLPFWPLGDGYFVLDDAGVDYAALAAAQPAPTASPMMSRMSSFSSTYDNPVYLTNLTASFAGDGSITASFSVAGGTNFVPYDIEVSTNLSSPDWTWLGIGYTSNNYTFYGQPAGLAFYRLAQPAKTLVIAWGNNDDGQCSAPAGLTNAVAVTGGAEHTIALLNDGGLAAWGDNTYGQTSIPAGLTNVAVVVANVYHNLALRTDGSLAIWGKWQSNSVAFFDVNLPTGLTNITAIAAGPDYDLAVRSDGSVAAWGLATSACLAVPTNLPPALDVAAGAEHAVALLTNGTVIAWGVNYAGQNETNVPAGLSNVVAIASGDYHTLALKADGTVVAWGAGTGNLYFDLGQSIVPAGLSNVVAIAAGGYRSIALKSDGTVVVWGDYTDPGFPVDQIMGIGSGWTHVLALRTGNTAPVITSQPADQYAPAGQTASFSVSAIGLATLEYQWQSNGVAISGATNTTLTLTNVTAADTAAYNVVVTSTDGMGSAVSSNADFYLVTPPVITSQAPMPTNQVAVYHTNLTLSVVAAAQGTNSGFPMYFQWQFNGTNILGATSSGYTFLVDELNSGNYSVVVANSVGSVTSMVWQVSTTYIGSYIAPGTLAYYLSTNTAAYTNGVSDIYDSEKELSGWVYGNYSGTNMALLTNSVWSTNFWLRGVRGLSATSIGISNSLAAQGSVTMISPRHCLYANHMHLPPGQFTAAFLDTNNVIYWRTNMQNVFIGNDTSLGILNEDLPPSVGFLPIIPTNYSDYLPTNSGSYIQGIGRNQEVMMFGQPMTYGYSPNVIWNPTVAVPFGLTTNWNVGIVGGDSSNPEMLLVSDQLVLTSHNLGASGGPNYALQIETINQQMHYLSTNNGVGTDYQLTQYALTNWPAMH